MTPEDADLFGVQDKDIVDVEVSNGIRPLTFGNVLVRVSSKYVLVRYITDYPVEPDPWEYPRLCPHQQFLKNVPSISVRFVFSCFIPFFNYSPWGDFTGINFPLVSLNCLIYKVVMVLSRFRTAHFFDTKKLVKHVTVDLWGRPR